MPKYLHVIKTQTYQNDSRLLKWIKSLENNGNTSKVFILEDNNNSTKNIRDGIKVESTSLISRKFFAKGKGYLFKIPEYSWKSIKFIRNSEAKNIVFHDLQHYSTLFILCLFKPRNKKLIWDLHELFHESLIKFYPTRKIIEFILNRVDLIVYTNEYRRDYTREKLKYNEKSYFVLNNYTDYSNLDIGPINIPPALEDWLDGEKYIIWLGGGREDRNFLSFLESYKSLSNLYKLVMLGKPDLKGKEFIATHKLEERIYSTFVDPEEMLSYIDYAEFSVVLYDHSTPNNYYCEPNRLYQLTSRGIPVIVGNNPQMTNLVQEYNCGLILGDDGSDVLKLSEALELMIKKKEYFKTNLERSNVATNLSWENQFKEFYLLLNL